MKIGYFDVTRSMLASAPASSGAGPKNHQPKRMVPGQTPPKTPMHLPWQMPPKTPMQMPMRERPGYGSTRAAVDGRRKILFGR